ncbi:hypothetical protein D9M70_470390 [compost metagenome]
MKGGGSGDALDEVHLAAGLDTSERAVAAGDPASPQEPLAAIGSDALQVHHDPAPADRGQQHVAELAQMVGLDALADQVRECRIRRASECEVVTRMGGSAIPTGLTFRLGLLLALFTLASDALALGFLGEHVALGVVAAERQPQLLGDHPGGIGLPAATQVGQQRYQVAALVAAGEVVPGAGGQVDAERSRPAVAAHRVGRPELFALARAVRQPVGEQLVGSEQRCVCDALNVEVQGHQCRPSGAS